MPIHKSRKRLYPCTAAWAALRARILERAGHRCEGSPRFPHCRAANYQPHPVTGRMVVLTLAKIEGQIRAVCPSCDPN